MSKFTASCAMYWWENWVVRLEIAPSFRWDEDMCDDGGCVGCPYFGGLYK